MRLSIQDGTLEYGSERQTREYIQVWSTPEYILSACHHLRALTNGTKRSSLQIYQIYSEHLPQIYTSHTTYRIHHITYTLHSHPHQAQKNRNRNPSHDFSVLTLESGMIAVLVYLSVYPSTPVPSIISSKGTL